MRGEKQIWAASLSMLVLSGNVYTPHQSEIGPSTKTVVEVILPTPMFMRETIPSLTTSKTETATPASSPSVTESLEPTTRPSPIEETATAAINQESLGAAGLDLVGIQPAALENEQQSDGSQILTPQGVYIFVSAGDNCATAFTSEDNTVDERGQLTIRPAFAGKLPGVNSPSVYNGPAMFQGRDIIQAEVAEFWYTRSDDVSRIADITHLLCDAYFNNLAALTTTTSDNP